jgi:hypothetical protein
MTYRVSLPQLNTALEELRREKLTVPKELLRAKKKKETKGKRDAENDILMNGFAKLCRTNPKNELLKSIKTLLSGRANKRAKQSVMKELKVWMDFHDEKTRIVKYTLEALQKGLLIYIQELVKLRLDVSKEKRAYENIRKMTANTSRPVANVTRKGMGFQRLSIDEMRRKNASLKAMEGRVFS